MSTLAIVNPVAGRGRATRVWARLHAELDCVRGWDSATTQRAGHARELAALAARDGVDRVVVIGGDGTICEVANGLAHSRTALAMVPVGTGNDTPSNLGVPINPFAAAALAASGEARPIDLGEIRTARRTTYFANVAGFGFDAEVAWRVNRVPKLVGGTLPYVAGVLQTLVQYRSPRMRVCVDGRAFEQRVFMIAIANNASYGGGMRIAPRARPDDGLFDICVVSHVSRVEVLRLVPKLYSGGHVGHPAVELVQGKEVTAETDDGSAVRCHADGELAGDLPASFRISPGALRCVTGSPQTMPSA